MLRLVKRPLAAFLGIWFLLVMIEPESVHSCPVHSEKVGASHSGHAGHHAAAQSNHQSHNDSAAQCSCPGDCTNTTVKALPSVAQEIVASTILVATSGNRFTESIHLPTSDFLLPFAIGPPASITA